MKPSVGQAVSNQLAWFETMHQENGFGGPVVHYWRNCLKFIGPGTDWRLEGLIQGYLELFRKTGNKQFLEKAVRCGNDALANQFSSGGFWNSNFEGNPTFDLFGQPHESAVDIGLLALAKELEKIKDSRSRIFLDCARRNLDRVLLKKFWNEKQGTFQQYPKGQWDQAPNLFVPNKIATACEALLLLSDLVREEKYQTTAVSAAEEILELQVKTGPMAGGIFQANERTRVISYYTARCINPLMQLSGVSQDSRFSKAARLAAGFVAKQQLPEGGFAFGFDGQEKRQVFPVFVAGAGDILRSLDQWEDYSRQVSLGTRWLLRHQNPSGGFASFEGINQKNSKSEKKGGCRWEDFLPVVGWNDKTFRFLVSQTGKSLPAADTSGNYSIPCENGVFSESKTDFRVDGAVRWVFNKNSLFSNNDSAGLKAIFYRMGMQSNRAAQWAGKAGLKVLLSL